MNLNDTFGMIPVNEKSIEDIKTYYEDWGNRENVCYTPDDSYLFNINTPFESYINTVPPDICYPEYGNTVIVNPVQPTSSPIIFGNDNYYTSNNTCSAVNWNNPANEETYYHNDRNLQRLLKESYPIENNSVAVFGNPMEQMEDTFRSALVQYFSQVDREKEGLSGDLRKIKDDFHKYVEEGKRYKNESIHQAKIIRKLTENGKLFVQEIERLKITLKHNEDQKHRLVKENVDLRKKVQYEDDVIPHLERELKSLSEENNYLKLFAEDTKQLEQQEIKIRHYVHQVEEQCKMNEIYVNDLNKQAQIISTLSHANDELGSEMLKLEDYKRENLVLKEKERKYSELIKEHEKTKQENYEYENEMNCLHSAINELQKELNELRFSSSTLSKKYVKQQETVKEKGQKMVELKEKLNNLEQLHTKDLNNQKNQETKIRELSEEILQLKKESNSLTKDLKSITMKNESLICEDEIRSKDYENLIKKLEVLENQCNELSKKERRYERDLKEKETNLRNYKNNEINYKNTINQLKTEIVDVTENSNRLDMKCIQLQKREEDLEKEILSLVKTNSEMEQETLLMSKTIETLKKSNDNCSAQRCTLQKDILTLQMKINAAEEHIDAYEENEKSIKEDLKNLTDKYNTCENQRNRLQKEILQIQDKLSRTEDEFSDYYELKQQLDEINESFNQLNVDNENLHGELIYTKDKNNMLELDLKNLDEMKRKFDEYENEVMELKHQLCLTEDKNNQCEEELIDSNHIKDQLKSLQNENEKLKDEINTHLRKIESFEFENTKLLEFKKLLQGCKTEKLLLLEENLILKDKVFTQESKSESTWETDQDLLSKQESLETTTKSIERHVEMQVQVDTLSDNNLELKEEILTLKEKLLDAKRGHIAQLKSFQQGDLKQKNANLIEENKLLKLQIESLKSKSPIEETDTMKHERLLNISLDKPIETISPVQSDNLLMDINPIKPDNLLMDNNTDFVSEETIAILKAENSVLTQENDFLKKEMSQANERNTELDSLLQNLKRKTSDETKTILLSENENLKLQLDNCLQEKQDLEELVDYHYSNKKSYEKIYNEETGTYSPLLNGSTPVSENDKTPLIKRSNDLIQFDSVDTLNSKSNIEMDSENITVIHNVTPEESQANLSSDMNSARKNSLKTKKSIFSKSPLHKIRKKFKSKNFKPAELTGHIYINEISAVPPTFSKDENSFLCSSDIVDFHGELEFNLNHENERPLRDNNSDEYHYSESTNKPQSVIEKLNTSLNNDQSNSMNTYIHNLEQEKKNLHEDIDNLLKDYQNLKNNFEELQKHLEAKETDIEELIYNLTSKDSIIKDLEIYIQDFQTDSEFQNATNFKELVTEKNSQIADLEIHFTKLQQNLNSKENEIENLLRELDHFKFLHQQNIRDINHLGESKKEVAEQPLILPQPNQPLKKLTKQYKEESELESPEEENYRHVIDELRHQLNQKQEIVFELEKKNYELKSNEEQLKHKESNNVCNTTLNDSFVTSTDDVTLANQNNLDIKVELQKKEELINDLHEHIRLLEQSFNERIPDSEQLVVDPMEKSCQKKVKFQLNLQLPQPNSSHQSRSKNSLPPIPGAKIIHNGHNPNHNISIPNSPTVSKPNGINANYNGDISNYTGNSNYSNSKANHNESPTYSNSVVDNNLSIHRVNSQGLKSNSTGKARPTSRPSSEGYKANSPGIKSPVISPGEIELSTMSNESSSGGDLRRKLVNLNSELLQKKIDVNKLEEELKVAKRKQERADESYRNVVSKNESLEHEIIENRNKIGEIQNKKGIYGFSNHRETSNGNVMIESLERKVKNLVAENSNLAAEIASKDKALQELQDNLETLELESNHLKNNSELLDEQLKEQIENKDKTQDENSSLKEAIMSLEITVKKLERDNESLRSKTQSSVNSYKDMKSEVQVTNKNVAEVKHENENLKMSLNICENERNIYELEIKEKERMIKDLEESLNECNKEKRLLRDENNDLESITRDHNMTKRDLVSGKEILDRNTKYLENKVNDLKQHLLEKEEKIFSLKKDRNESDDSVNKYAVELNYKIQEIKKLEDELNSEASRFERLEKLSDEMNNENKKLMHELLILKENISNANDENSSLKEKLIKFEKEQKDLDNIVLKTQKSNNELLDNNQILNKEIRNLKKSIDQISQQINNKENQVHKLERKLQLTEEELSRDNNNLINENRELIEELNVTRNTINDFENILDQGQMDFDELESQLELYRKENITLDKKLHDVLKAEMKLKSENEDYERRIVSFNKEIFSLKEKTHDLEFHIKDANIAKEETEMKNQEYKSRDEYFAERLKGYENILQTKEEMIQNDKNEKEKLQSTVLNLQAKLIEVKTTNEKLMNDKEGKMNDIIVKRNEIEYLEKSSLNLSIEKEDLSTQLNDTSTKLKNIQETLSNVQLERDEFETELQKTNEQLITVENELENEKLKYHQDKEEFLIEISSLKRKMIECSVDVEKHEYKHQNLENEVKQVTELKDRLADEIQIKNEEYQKEKKNIIEGMNKLRMQFQLIDQEKQQEINQLKATMEAIDESRGQDVSLLNVKLKESEDLRKLLNKEQNLTNRKDNEIESLKEDIVQLQTDIDSIVEENEELKNNIKHRSSRNLSLEKENHTFQLEISKLLVDIENKDERISMFEEQKKNEKLEKMNIKTEKEKLEKSFDIMVEEKDLSTHKLETEIRSLRQQVKTLDIVREENDKLKSELDVYVNERRGYQGKTVEITQLRSENFELRNKAERSQEHLNENRLLRQELRDKESRHLEITEKLNREITTLKRQNDDIFKQNQDLELRNANIVRTRPRNAHFFDSSQRMDAVTSALRQKSHSQENMTEIGIDGDNFSPTRNAIATSTPTQEINRFAPSLTSAKQPSQPKILSSIDRSKTSNEAKNELSTRPSISLISEQVKVIAQKKQAANTNGNQWVQSNEDLQRSGSIKLNPFLQMDKTAKTNWKAGAAAMTAFSKSTAATPTTPRLSIPLSKFDMRPKSTDVSLENIDVPKSPNKPFGVGNEFVNRLKAAFETN